MGSIIIESSQGALKATLTHVLRSTLHDSLSGEKTFSFQCLISDAPDVAPGDLVTYDGESYDVVRVSKRSGIPFSTEDVSCEHISYRLLNFTVPAGTYTGTPPALMAVFIQGTGFTGVVEGLTAPVNLIFSSDTNVRAALVGLAAVSGGEMLYEGTTVNLVARIGSAIPVELSDKLNVETISATIDNRNSSQSYGFTFYRETVLGVGDAVSINYDSLGLHTSSRIISLDRDPFNPMHVNVVTGDFVPNFVNGTIDSFDDYEETFEETLEETKEEIIDEVTEEIVPAEIDSKLEVSLIRAKEMNFADWDNGSFYEILDNDVQINYTVLFDGQGRPVLIVDDEHICEIVW